MVKVWFLLALVSYPNYPAIVYRGFGGFLEKEECIERKTLSEEYIINYELKMGREAIVKSFCLEMNAFPSSLKNKNDLGV